MGRKKQNKAVGCLFLIVVFIAAGAAAVNAHPFTAIPAGIVAVVLIIKMLMPKRCEICNNLIKRNSYNWEIGGKKTLVCVHCNQSFERKQSKREINKRFT
jgi:hypothetical protein